MSTQTDIGMLTCDAQDRYVSQVSDSAVEYLATSVLGACGWTAARVIRHTL